MLQNFVYLYLRNLRGRSTVATGLEGYTEQVKIDNSDSYQYLQKKVRLYYKSNYSQRF